MMNIIQLWYGLSTAEFLLFSYLRFYLFPAVVLDSPLTKQSLFLLRMLLEPRNIA